MFNMGGSEILVILIVALLFLGPDKLPEAAKQISKGIRDLKKQGRVLQQTIENDETIGGALKDLKSALRGDEAPVRPPVRKPPPKPEAAAPAADAEAKPDMAPASENNIAGDAPALPAPAKPAVTLPGAAGEIDPDSPRHGADAESLAALVKPAAGTIAKADPAATPDEPLKKHG